jgi:hypothetical protein
MCKIRIFSILVCIGSFLFYSFSYAYDGQNIEVTVIKNDCLINLCKKYLMDHRKWRKIAKINRLANPDLIFPGQKLIIPVALLKGVPIDGTATFLKGSVMSHEKGSGEWRDIHLSDRIKQGSGVKTGNESALEITFEDGTSFYMRPDTLMDITTAEKKGSIHFMRELYLRSGKAISKLREATGSESRFEIHTPSAVAAARGTVFRVSVDQAETTRSEVLKGMIGVSAMSTTVALQEGEGTLTRANEPPLKPRKLLLPPELIDPASVYKTMPLKFRFQQREGASFFRVILAKDQGIKDMIADKVMSPDGTAEVFGLDDGMYFLQSLSIDADGIEGLPSDPVPIRVRMNPLPPYIQAPQDGTEIRGKSVEFRWLKVKDASRYHIQIAEDKEFSAIVLDKSDIKDTSYVATSPGYNTSYYFRLSSIAGDNYEGAPSDALSFSIVPPPPSVEKPAVGDKEIRIRWHNLGKGITYHFQMSPDTAFNNIAVDKTLQNPEVTLNAPEKAGIYFVRTSSIDLKGRESDFSVPQSFEVKNKIPFLPLSIIGAAWLIIWLVF